VNPFGVTVLPPDELITRKVNVDLFPALRSIVSTLASYGDEFTANAVMTELAALEAAAGTGNIAVYGGYDTNDVRRWNALFTSFITWLNSNVTTTLATGSTETKTAKNIVMKYYAPVE